jgi:hypothetical protein
MTDSRPHWANTLYERYKYHQEHYTIAKELGDQDSADIHSAISQEIISILEELGQLVM